ncbi:MAG: DUF503 family protein [Desulfuromonadaceae bacterium]|nr:DUF503 family protein [Desulfuromonadaceae bacterium]
MVVGVLRLELRLFAVHSLKQKRSQVSRVLSRLRSRYPISVAEVGYQDLYQRALLGISMTACTEAQVASVFRKLEDEIYTLGIAELLDTDIEYLHYGEEIH